MQRRLLIFASAALIGCASTSGPAPAPISAVTNLPAQTLKAGECGLFVWTGDSKRKFILFSQAQTQTGVWYSGETVENLSTHTQTGQPANNQFPETSYVTSTGAKLSLSLERRESIINGTRFKSGTLKVSDPEAWERITPVVGLSACKTE